MITENLCVNFFWDTRFCWLAVVVVVAVIAVDAAAADDDKTRLNAFKWN